jgi:hypothetical protein
MAIKSIQPHKADLTWVMDDGMRRLGIPWGRVPENLRGTPFEVVEVIKKNRWKEIALRWRL